MSADRTPTPPHLQPLSRLFGTDLGTPIDRYYIERFLAAHAADIHGRTLEVGDAVYTRRFGATRVTHADVLHATPGNRHATIVGNLETGAGLPHDAFDCMILTQVLPFVFDLPVAVATIHRALKPGGVALITAPGISQISRYDMDRWGDFWRFTTLSLRRLLERPFGPANVAVAAFGNVHAASNFLNGVPVERMKTTDLDYTDPDYELLITARATKA